MLPYLTEVQNASKKYSVMFRGINYGEGAQDGEFAQTYNLSTDSYPCITQRAARVDAGKYTKPTTLHAKGKLLVINDVDDKTAEVYYGGEKIENAVLTAGKKQTATIGDYVVIFPDKKYYKVPTEDENGEMQEGEFGSMEEIFTMSGLAFTDSTISIKTPKREQNFPWLEFTESAIKIGTEYKARGIGFLGDTISCYQGDFPFKAGDKITISGDPNISPDKVYTIESATSTELKVNTYLVMGSVSSGLEITITRIVEEEFQFEEGKTVVITGCSSDNNKEVIIESISEDKQTLNVKDKIFTKATEVGEITITQTNQFNFSKGDAVTITGCSKSENNKTAEIIIRGATSDKLTFDASTFTAVDNETNTVTISRTVPDLDFICESNYRLWGTHKNTIYSSKFSYPLNFKSFDGLAEDSYAIEVASEGEFTGCIAYSSHICFFKENTLHKLYGTKPSNFQITTANVYGVQSGSERSMQIVNEQLLYKGVGGVYAYTGGVPELLSEKLGNRRYSDAVACCDGEKYYISMKQGDTYDMFAYDVAKNIWLREDDTQAVDMTFFDGKVYFIDAKGGLYYIDKTADRGGIEWGATFCTMHETINERKGYSKFHLRMDLSAGAWLAVDIKTDNDLKWKQVYLTHNEKARTVSIPIMPTRCDTIDIRLRGKGKCTIKAFIREFTVGSDV